MILSQETGNPIPRRSPRWSNFFMLHWVRILRSKRTPSVILLLNFPWAHQSNLASFCAFNLEKGNLLLLPTTKETRTTTNQPYEPRSFEARHKNEVARRIIGPSNNLVLHKCIIILESWCRAAESKRPWTRGTFETTPFEIQGHGVKSMLFS